MDDDNILIRREKIKRNRLRYAERASFKKYIQDVLRNIAGQGEASISEPALEIVDTIIRDVFFDLSAEAKRLMVASKKRTMTVWDIHSAVRATLQGSVFQNARANGQRALVMYGDMTRQK